MTQIQVLEIKPVDNSNLKAFVKIKIGETTFHDFRIVQQSGQKVWVSPPATQWTRKDGKTYRKVLIELPRRLKEAVSNAVLEAWNKQEGGNE